MRRPTTVALLERFMAELGREGGTANVYFTGGVTAILHGWRDATADVDFVADPESERVVRAASRLKDALDVNVEVAAPHHFVPALPGWRERSIFIGRAGDVSYFHYDPYGQVLAKLERGHTQDVEDVESMLSSGMVDPDRLRELFTRVESELERYPAVDRPTLRRAVESLRAPGTT